MSDDDEDVQVVHEHLVRIGAVAPVELEGAEERLWLDCDLASLAENRLGDTADPRHLDEARRADWQARATEERPYKLASRGRYESFYWLLEDDERIGTVALATSTLLLVCDPALAPHLIESLLHMEVPRHNSVGTVESALDQLVPIEFRADLVLDLRSDAG